MLGQLGGILIIRGAFVKRVCFLAIESSEWSEPGSILTKSEKGLLHLQAFMLFNSSGGKGCRRSSFAHQIETLSPTRREPENLSQDRRQAVKSMHSTCIYHDLQIGVESHPSLHLFAPKLSCGSKSFIPRLSPTFRFCLYGMEYI